MLPHMLQVGIKDDARWPPRDLAALRRVQVALGLRQGAPKRPKSFPNLDKISEFGLLAGSLPTVYTSRWLQEGPREAQEGPKSAQERPKSAARGPQEAHLKAPAGGR